MKLTIARALNTFGFAVILGCVIIAGAATYSLQQLRVGGSAYGNMIAGKDLVADVLPPPLYIIEAYLNAHLISDEKVTLEEARLRFSPLRRDFEERRAVWARSDLPTHLKAEVAASSAAAEKFWLVLEDKYLPALAKEDQASVQRTMRDLTALYTDHRRLVDVLVLDANKFLASSEAEAQTAGNMWQNILLATAGLVLIGVIFGIIAIRNRVIRPILGMADYMSRLAKGRFEEEVPFTGRAD